MKTKCPTCQSPDPKKHPAVQFEGEVHLCSDPWHKPTAAEIAYRDAITGANPRATDKLVAGLRRTQ